MLADLLESAALRLSIPKSEIDVTARPVVPERYREKGPQDITEVRDIDRTKRHGDEIGLIPNPDIDVKTAEQNILLVYDLATPEEVAFWSKWYTMAQRDVKALAAELSVPFELMAAVVAILSPGNKWASNLIAAARTIQLAEKAMQDPERDQIEQQIESLRAELQSNPGRSKPIQDEIKKQVQRYGDLSRKHQQKIASYPANVRKAINVLESEDPTKWVSGPKVSKFYDAIVDPEKVEREMVLDGHAINLAAGIRQDLKSAMQATGERRARLLQAYENAAKARNTTTRAVQAITWAQFQTLIPQKNVS